jgi:hypothetical protein
MKAKCFFLVSAFSLVPCYVQAGLADAPNGIIDQFVILVHSFTLSTVQERFVVGRNLEALISVIKSAEVKSQMQ